MFKRIALSCLALVAALAASFTTVQAKSLDDIIKDGVIRIGINPNFPPNSARGAGGDWEGFDIDIGNKIAAALGVKVEWVPTETPQRVPFLVADKIDISLGALTRSAERAKLIEYTVPLHSEVMAVLTTDKVDIKDWKELNDSKYTLANMRGNWSVDYLKKELPNAKMELVDTHRRHRAPGRPGSRRRDRREHRLLHEAHQELSRREMEGAAQPDRRRLVRHRRRNAATIRCATCSTSFSTACIPAIS